MTTGQVYNEYNKIIHKIESNLLSRSFLLSKCLPEQVKKRIVQKIIELTINEFSLLNTKDGDNEIGEKIILNGVSINFCTGDVSISVKLVLKQLLVFILQWIKISYYLSKSLLLKSGKKEIVTVLIEAGGDYLGNDMDLVLFCRKGPIKKLHNGSIIIGSKCETKVKNDEDIFYSKNALIDAINHTTSVRQRFYLLIMHSLFPFRLVSSFLSDRLSFLAISDAAYIVVLDYLNKQNKLRDIFITTSSFSSQPIWMRGLKEQKFKLNMIWYSQNFIPKIYKGEEFRSDLPQARHMRVDEHWVWTYGFSTYLKSIGQESIFHVVGPLLWYLPNAQLKDLSLNSFMSSEIHKPIRVAIFDVTPFVVSSISSVWGAIKNYYSLETITKFINDILSLKNLIEELTNRKVIFYLKHKRPPKLNHHSSEYIKFIDSLVSTREDFVLMASETNLFNFITSCDISVSVPYTTTAYVSSSLSKPGIYYDSSEELEPYYEKSEFVYYASGKTELGNIFIKLLSADNK